MNRYTQPEFADLLAAEYVLGTLKGRARQRFERLQTEYPSIAAQVEAWEFRLNNMVSGSRPIAPPDQVWSGLEKRLFTEVPIPDLIDFFVREQGIRLIRIEGTDRG